MARRYFKWLTSQIEADDEAFEELFLIMNQRQFFWLVPNDDNRVEDARELRHEYWATREDPFPGDQDSVTILEMLVALSRRCAFTGGSTPEKWAWQLITNLGLNKMRGQLSARRVDHILEILDRFVWRKYEPNGSGGLFPLNHAREDQTKVEIWNQMNTYIIENDLM